MLYYILQLRVHQSSRTSERRCFLDWVTEQNNRPVCGHPQHRHSSVTKRCRLLLYTLGHTLITTGDEAFERIVGIYTTQWPR